MENTLAIEKLFTYLDLAHLCERFLSLGYDQLQDIIYLEKDRLDTLIDSPEEKAKFLRGLHEERCVVSLWLQHLGLDVYQDTLFSHGMTSLNSFVNMTPQSVERFGITNHAHKARLLRAVQVLVESYRSRVIAVGEWDFHEQAPRGRVGYFLCLTAEVHNTDNKEPSTVRKIKFLVDSGSDVVTLRHDVIHDLQLEQIGIAKQSGAGGVVVETPVYRACVKVGGKTVSVEVVSDSMDSLGTSVLRHFNHFIHNDKHFWLEKTA